MLCRPRFDEKSFYVLQLKKSSQKVIFFVKNFDFVSFSDGCGPNKKCLVARVFETPGQERDVLEIVTKLTSDIFFVKS
jgi:hypothetical protein